MSDQPASGLDLVLPDSAELVWGIIGLVLLLAIVVAVVVMVRKAAASSDQSLDRDAQITELHQRVSVLESQAHSETEPP